MTLPDLSLCDGDMNWSCRKLLQICNTIRPFIWYKIGNGEMTFVWFDKWYDLILNEEWIWSSDWYTKYNSLAQVLVPALNSDCIRISENDVPWFNVVWFHPRIRRHDVHIWLVINRKLKTQDRLKQLDVWSMVRMLSGMDSVSPRFEYVVEFLIPSSKGRSARSIISRIVMAATFYFIWQERNARLCKKKSKSHILIYESIIAIVRLKLLSFRFNKTNTHVCEMLATWKLPSSLMIYDDDAYALQ
ncbi:hypothetical protein Tco_1203261 [Tanacetum coccineum]